MAIICPKCGKQYDVTLFQFGKEVVCECGQKVGRRSGFERPEKSDDSSLLVRSARIKVMIADDDVPKSAILRAVDELRDLYLGDFPGDGKGFEEKFGSGLRRLYRVARGEDLFKEI